MFWLYGQIEARMQGLGVTDRAARPCEARGGGYRV